ncbi:MAG TPA: ATP-binding cassette domain-containing protein [Elusimicrobiales bacterium]|nr:ATP-binding cassette domain-containing protein [Elusimicrobiales bacterium]
MGNKVLLEARDLAFAYPSGTENVFSGASFRLYRGDKTALLGDNGSGKTTLLRMLAGELEPSAGDLALRGAGVFLLRQEDSAEGAGSALDWLREGLLESGDWDLAAELYAGAARLGFAAADLERPVETFSGGERKMLALMAGFLRRPDLYLLDEPTNYLDAAAMARLSGELKRFRGAFVVVSHDRAFLDDCVEKVLELKRSEFAVYEGNYSAYAAQKRAEFELAVKKKEKIEGQIAHLRVMERNYRDWGAAKEKEKIGAADKGFIGARAARLQKKSARAARRAREKIEELEREKPFVEKVRSAFLPPAAPSWLEVSGLSKRLGSRTLFKDLSFRLKSGGRLVLEGDNGAGKSTLMRILAGELEADAGEVRRGRSARVFYLPQFRPAIRPGARGRDYFPGALLERACTMLDHLGADGEHMFRPLEGLSEGQRRKVELVRFLVNGADIALLDEPTTHQDIRTVRVLEEELASYAGILVLISHDAAFRSALPGEVLRL